MRHALIAAGILAALTATACTPRPKRASGPTLPWDTAGATVKVAASPASGGSPILGEWFGFLPSADGVGRDYILYLNRDGSARLVTMFRKPGVERIIETGMWSAVDSAITVEIAEKDGRPVPSFLAYDLKGRELVPAAAWDSTLWGSEGPPVLKRR